MRLSESFLDLKMKEKKRFTNFSIFFRIDQRTMNSPKRRWNDTHSSDQSENRSTFRIFFFSSKEYDRTSFSTKLNELKQPENFQIDHTVKRLSKETVGLADGYPCISIFVNDDCSREVLEKLKQIGVQLIVLRCAGFNNVDLNAAENLNIEIGYIPGYSPHAVAEHAVALTMTLNRSIHRAYNRVRNGDFRLEGLVGFDMNGKTVGVLGLNQSKFQDLFKQNLFLIGTGRIGQFTIRIFRGFACRVLAFDSFPIKDEDRLALGFDYTTLDEIYEQSDIISIHLPLDDTTKHMINAKSIGQMKHGVILINTARGALIDTKALINGLRSGRIGGVGLDVYEHEQRYFFNDFSSSIVEDDDLLHLMSYPNVILTGHQAFLTKEALSSIAKTTLENIHSFVTVGKPIYSPKS